MDKTRIDHYSEELYQALRGAQPVDPLTAREADISIEDAYQIQLGIIQRRMQRDGETIIGKKIGATSKAVQTMLGVDQPDFGHLMSGMAYNDGDVVPIEGGTVEDLETHTDVNGDPIEKNPNFGNPIAFQSPRLFRFGVRLNF